ncbi:MAG: hypothetical protein Q4D41_03865 [Prevotellaceae bacterium]|nr:hypothetical protein [Prevotellaceae bacterium]
MAKYNNFLFALGNQCPPRLKYFKASRKRKKSIAFIGWLSFTLIFFLYDVIWIFADWKDFILQYVNFINGKPIGRIKYALS